MLFAMHLVSTGTFILLVGLTFFVASAGASSAYLTVSEIFPMETRGLAIALFYASGTIVGGVTGPALFGQFIHSGQRNLVAIGFFVGAAAMVLGGIAELRWGVAAERQSLELVATPLSAESADRITTRNADRAAWERRGARRFRPGPSDTFYSPRMIGTTGQATVASDEQLDREIQAVGTDLATHGPTPRRELAHRLRAKEWGPGRFASALREAESESRVRRLSHSVYGPSR